MAIFLVIPNYHSEGYGRPVAAFTDAEGANTFIRMISEGYGPTMIVHEAELHRLSLASLDIRSLHPWPNAVKATDDRS